jgi:hypothetical protein
MTVVECREVDREGMVREDMLSAAEELRLRRQRQLASRVAAAAFAPFAPYFHSDDEEVLGPGTVAPAVAATQPPRPHELVGIVKQRNAVRRQVAAAQAIVPPDTLNVTLSKDFRAALDLPAPLAATSTATASMAASGASTGSWMNAGATPVTLRGASKRWLAPGGVRVGGGTLSRGAGGAAVAGAGAGGPSLSATRSMQRAVSATSVRSRGPSDSLGVGAGATGGGAGGTTSTTPGSPLRYGVTKLAPVASLAVLPKRPATAQASQ